MLSLSLLTPIHTDTCYETKIEKYWYEALYQSKDIQITSVRFLHFFTTHPITEREEFHNALHSILGFDTPTIWETSQTGVLILTENTSEYRLQTALDTLETDFFYILILFCRQTLHPNQSSFSLVSMGTKFIFLSFSYLSKKITYIEQLLLIN